MAFNAKERAIIQWSTENGKSSEETRDALVRFRTTGSPINPASPPVEEEVGFVRETGGDIAETFGGITREFGKAGEDIVATVGDESLNPFQKALQVGSQAFRGGARAFGEGVVGIGKAVLPQETEEAIGQGAQEFGEAVAQRPEIQQLVQNYEKLDPETKRNIDNALGFGEGLAEILTGGAASRIAKPIVKGVGEAVSEISKKASKFTLPVTIPKAPITNKFGVEVIKDIVPTRDALRDNLIATSFRLAPVEDIARIEAVTGNNIGEFLGRYDLIKDTPVETLSALNKFKSNNYNLVRDAISLVDEKFTFNDIPQLADTIDFLISDLKPRKSVEYQEALRIIEGIKESGTFDLSQAQYIKGVFDDIESVYKRTGDVRDAISAQDKANTISPVRRFIEDRVQEQYPEMNINVLNNNVQTAREISDAVIKRSGKADTSGFFRLGDLAVIGAGNFHVPGLGYAAFFGKKLFESAPIKLRLAKKMHEWAQKGVIDTKGLSTADIDELNKLIQKELGEAIDIKDF